MKRLNQLRKPAVRAVLIIAALFISILLMTQGCRSKEMHARYGVQKTTY